MQTTSIARVAAVSGFVVSTRALTVICPSLTGNSQTSKEDSKTPPDVSLHGCRSSLKTDRGWNGKSSPRSVRETSIPSTDTVSAYSATVVSVQLPANPDAKTTTWHVPSPDAVKLNSGQRNSGGANAQTISSSAALESPVVHTISITRSAAVARFGVSARAMTLCPRLTGNSQRSKT